MTKLAYVLSSLVLAASLTTMPLAAKEVTSMRVDFSDLNLQTDAGVKRLDDRLRAAIKRMCGASPHRTDLITILATKSCQAQTVADVSPQRDAAIRNARTNEQVRVTWLDMKRPSRAN